MTKTKTITRVYLDQRLVLSSQAVDLRLTPEVLIKLLGDVKYQFILLRGAEAVRELHFKTSYRAS